MNTYLTKKRLLPALALACLAPLASHNAQAAVTFGSYAKMTYTIDSITNAANPGNFSGLGISGSFEFAPDQSIQHITGDGSVTPLLSGSGNPSPVPGGSYSRTFKLNGTANDGADVAANYLAWFGLAFQNTSTNSYDIGVTLSYELSAKAVGNNAFTDVTLNYFNEKGNFAGSDYIDAITGGNNLLKKSSEFSFTLAPSASGKLSIDTGISGTLQPEGVPLPSAFWLFASALLALPGIRKSKRTV